VVFIFGVKTTYTDDGGSSSFPLASTKQGVTFQQNVIVIDWRCARTEYWTTAEGNGESDVMSSLYTTSGVVRIIRTRRRNTVRHVTHTKT
jgi:hypothetical protein